MNFLFLDFLTIGALDGATKVGPSFRVQKGVTTTSEEVPSVCCKLNVKCVAHGTLPRSVGGRELGK